MWMHRVCWLSRFGCVASSMLSSKSSSLSFDNRPLQNNKLFHILSPIIILQ